jgi:hypothetical protein
MRCRCNAINGERVDTTIASDRRKKDKQLTIRSKECQRQRRVMERSRVTATAGATATPTVPSPPEQASVATALLDHDSIAARGGSGLARVS